MGPGDILVQLREHFKTESLFLLFKNAGFREISECLRAVRDT